MKNLKNSLVIFFSTLLIPLLAQVQNREHYIDQSTFISSMSSALDGNVMGYQYSVGDQNGVLFTGVNGNTRSAEDNGGAASIWTTSSQMIIASVSKIICTVAIMDMLESATIPNAPTLDDKLDLLLKDYLPLRWRSLIDQNQNQITLRHLLNHHSGINYGFPRPKNGLATVTDVPLPASFNYSNVNFDLAGFMAIYLAYPNTMNTFENDLAPAIDLVYDSGMGNAIFNLFESYVQSNIFLPAGITASCARFATDPSSTEVYKYGAPNDNVGTDFGTVETCMSNGWVLSSENLIQFVQKWTNPHLSGNILTSESVSLINEFPVSAVGTPLGWYLNLDTYNGAIEGYAHNGIWHNLLEGGCLSDPCDLYTTSLAISEDNVYMAINVNSNSFTSNNKRREVNMRTAYNAAVCAPNIIVDNNSMVKYNSAENTLTTNTIGSPSVGSNETVVFKAGQTVILTPGFTASPTSKFRAYIDNCNNLPTFD